MYRDTKALLYSSHPSFMHAHLKNIRIYFNKIKMLFPNMHVLSLTYLCPSSLCISQSFLWVIFSFNNLTFHCFLSSCIYAFMLSKQCRLLEVAEIWCFNVAGI